MIETLLEIMRGIAGMTALGALAELLAPSDRVRQDVRLLCGFLVMLCVFGPIVEGLKGFGGG